MSAPTSQTVINYHQWAIGDLVRVEHMPPPPLQVFSISAYGIVYSVDDRPDVEDDMKLGIVTKNGRILKTPLQSDSVRFIKSTDLQYNYEGPSKVIDDHKEGVFSAYFVDLPDASTLLK